MSQQLAALERELGCRSWTGGSAAASDPRRAALRPSVDRALAALGPADAVVDDLRGGVSRLRLAAFPSALSSFVPAAVRDLRRTHEAVVVQEAQLETREAVEHLRAGAADIAVVHHMPGVAMPDVGGLQAQRLAVDELHVVVPEGHRLAARVRRSPSPTCRTSR